MQLIIDRFDGEYAICESSSGDFTLEIPRDTLLGYMKEGDVITCDSSGAYFIDVPATNARRRNARKLLDSLFDS